LVFVAIAEDGTVTIVCHPFGNGSGRTHQSAMVVADELEANWLRVRSSRRPAMNRDTATRIPMAPAACVTSYADAPCRRGRPQHAGSAAAAHWQVPVQEVRAEQHQVLHPRTAEHSATVSWPRPQQNCRACSRNFALKKPAEFRYISKGQLGIYDGQDIVMGRHSTASTPALKTCFTPWSRPPVFGGRFRVTMPRMPQSTRRG